MDVSVSGSVEKRGDSYVQFHFNRRYISPPQETSGGDGGGIAVFTGEVSGPPKKRVTVAPVEMQIKANPVVEELIKSFGEGSADDAAGFGREWTPIGDTKKLLVYDVSRMPTMPHGINLSSVGTPFITRVNVPGVGHTEVINLGFLRLKGISERDGLTFGIVTPHGLSDLKDIKTKLSRSLKLFCDEFLCPIDMTCYIVSQ